MKELYPCGKCGKLWTGDKIATVIDGEIKVLRCVECVQRNQRGQKSKLQKFMDGLSGAV